MTTLKLRYVGRQQGYGRIPSFRLYNITQGNLGSYLYGFTVSDKTIKRLAHVLTLGQYFSLNMRKGV